jgi:hydrogenase expression/formation protein HypE
VRPGVRGVCEVLGLDPLYLACEGRVVAVVAEGRADAALAALRSIPAGSEAQVIGEIVPRAAGPVVLRTLYGGQRLYDTLASDPLPRIC